MKLFDAGLLSFLVYRAMASSVSVGFFRSAFCAKTIRCFLRVSIVFGLAPLRSLCSRYVFMSGSCGISLL